MENNKDGLKTCHFLGLVAWYVKKVAHEYNKCYEQAEAELCQAQFKLRLAKWFS